MLFVICSGVVVALMCCTWCGFLMAISPHFCLSAFRDPVLDCDAEIVGRFGPYQFLCIRTFGKCFTWMAPYLPCNTPHLNTELPDLCLPSAARMQENQCNPKWTARTATLAWRMDQSPGCFSSGRCFLDRKQMIHGKKVACSMTVWAMKSHMCMPLWITNLAKPTHITTFPYNVMRYITIHFALLYSAVFPLPCITAHWTIQIQAHTLVWWIHVSIWCWQEMLVELDSTTAWWWVSNNIVSTAWSYL